METVRIHESVCVMVRRTIRFPARFQRVLYDSGDLGNKVTEMVPVSAAPLSRVERGPILILRWIVVLVRAPEGHESGQGTVGGNRRTP